MIHILYRRSVPTVVLAEDESQPDVFGALGSPSGPIQATIYVPAGVVLGNESRSGFTLALDQFDPRSILTLYCLGNTEGYGGNGGDSVTIGYGGDALDGAGDIVVSSGPGGGGQGNPGGLAGVKADIPNFSTLGTDGDRSSTGSGGDAGINRTGQSFFGSDSGINISPGAVGGDAIGLSCKLRLINKGLIAGGGGGGSAGWYTRSQGITHQFSGNGGRGGAFGERGQYDDTSPYGIGTDGNSVTSLPFAIASGAEHGVGIRLVNDDAEVSIIEGGSPPDLLGGIVGP